MADEAFCEVCGDTGGALSMVICENTDLGCLGGVHLYCCVPLRTEAPTEAWYCSQCSRARQEAAKAQQAARLARKRQRQEQRRQRRRQRQLDLQERQRQQLGQEHPAAASMPAPPPDKRQEDGKEVGRAQAQQEGASQPEQTAGGVGGAGSAAAAAPIAAPTAAAAAVAPPAGSQQGGAAQRKRSGLAAAIAAMVSGGPAAAAQAGGQHPSRPPGSAAPQQAQQVPQAAACRDTLATLFATLDRQDEASREQQRRVSLQVDGTSRLMQRSLSEREARQQALQRQLSLAACRGTRLHWRGRLQLPLPQEACPWGTQLLCYGLPGNLHSVDAARWLVPLADAAAQGRQPPARLVPMEELGITQEQAYLGASLLLVQDEPEPAQQAAQRQRWFALWHALSSSNQAVAIPVPPGEAMAVACSSTGLQNGQLEGLFLALVPNRFDPDACTLFGLLAVPHKAALPPKEAVPARSILRRAAPLAGAEAAGVQPGGSSSDLPPPGQPASEAAAARAGVGWADGSRDDTPPAAAAGQLELREGPHYATPNRRGQQAARPARLPAIRSFDASPAGPRAAPLEPLPLEGLHLAVVGFTVGTGWMPGFLKELRDLGATVYTSKVVLADVLVLHPGALQGGLDAHFEGTFPLGLAHLLATSDVRAYSDSSLQVLHDMKRLRRRLQGEEWQRPSLAFPGGMLVLLDAAALCFMPTAALSEVLSHMQRLQAASPDAHWLWGVAAAPADLAALQAAAEHGHTPAADNWQLWQRSSTARQLTPAELSSSAGHDGMPPAVVHASKAARVHAACCRLVYLCSSHEDTLRQAEGRVSILSGTPDDLLEFLSKSASSHLPQQAA